MASIQNIIVGIITFINNVFVPLIFALAFAFFLFGVFKYFFLGGTEPKNREEGRKYIIASVIAFAVMVSVWGLVNLVGNLVYLNKNQPDLPTFNIGGGNTNGSGSNSNSNGASGGIPAGPDTTGIPAGPDKTTPATQTGPCANGACADVQGLY